MARAERRRRPTRRPRAGARSAAPPADAATPAASADAGTAAASSTSAAVRRTVEALLVLALGAVALHAALHDVTDEDLWWHLASGRWIVAHGSIPTRDVFSWTHAGAPWVNQEWLAQVLFFELFARGGGTALALLKIAIAMVLFASVAWIGWRRSGSLPFAVLAAGAAAIVCGPYLDVRPQLFTFLGTVVVLAVVDAYRAGGSGWLLALLPPMLAVWANVHGGFLYGILLVALVATGEVAKAAWPLPDAPMPRRRGGTLAVAAAVAAVACLANHEGTRAFTLPLALASGGERAWRSGIVEWTPPVLFREGPFNPVAFGWVLVAELGVAAITLSTAPRRFDVTDALVATVTAAMALRARRFVPLFALVAAPWTAQNLAVLWTARFRAPGSELARPGRALAVGLAALSVTATTAATAIPAAHRTYAAGLFSGMVREWYFPESAVDFLQTNPLPGRAFHVYAWGGYLMWRLPERGVFIDPRAHTVYPLAFFQEAMIAEWGQPGWEDVLDRHGVALVVWPSENFAGALYGNLLRGLGASPRWQRIYDDGHATVFAHVVRGRVWVAKYRAFRLRYPDVPAAQLFLANAYLDAGRFEDARRHMQRVLRNHPETALVSRRMEERFLAQTRATDGAVAWFGLAFARDVLGERREAADAYRTALAKGLTGPEAAYTRDAFARLSGAPPP